MRISDWSSDVCSSDLVTDVVGDELRYTAWVAINARGVMYPLEMVGPTGRLDRANLGIEGALQGLAPVGAPRRTVDSAGQPTIVVGVPCRTGEPAAVAVIGRASCRERVGQYG